MRLDEITSGELVLRLDSVIEDDNRDLVFGRSGTEQDHPGGEDKDIQQRCHRNCDVVDSISSAVFTTRLFIS